MSFAGESTIGSIRNKSSASVYTWLQPISFLGISKAHRFNSELSRRGLLCRRSWMTLSTGPMSWPKFRKRRKP